MENSKPSSLYLNEDVLVWKNALKAYNDVLNLKASKERSKAKKGRDLVALDDWYQNELPKSLSSREKTYLNKEELCQLMTWKLTRGKFRPRLSDLVKANDESVVENTSRKAFECLPDVSSAIRELSKLKAVGPATASAILSAGAPDFVPFMADEAMMAIPDLGEINYNLPFYMKFVEKIGKVLKQLKKKDEGVYSSVITDNEDRRPLRYMKTRLKIGLPHPDGEWTAHKVELALWTEVMAKKYDFDLSLSKEPHVNGCENGVESAKRKNLDEKEAPKTKKRAKKK